MSKLGYRASTSADPITYLVSIPSLFILSISAISSSVLEQMPSSSLWTSLNKILMRWDNLILYDTSPLYSGLPGGPITSDSCSLWSFREIFKGAAGQFLDFMLCLILSWLFVFSPALRIRIHIWLCALICLSYSFFVSSVIVSSDTTCGSATLR